MTAPAADAVDAVEDVVLAVGGGRLPTRRLPASPTLDLVIDRLDLEPIGTEQLGRDGRATRRFSVASSRYEGGLVVHADDEGRIVLVLGADPAEPSGEPTPTDEVELGRLGPPGLVLDAALGRITLAGAERVWPEHGIAVRTNPANGLLLAVLVFVPTDAAGYLADTRPDAEPEQLMVEVGS